MNSVSTSSSRSGASTLDILANAVAVAAAHDRSERRGCQQWQGIGLDPSPQFQQPRIKSTARARTHKTQTHTTMPVQYVMVENPFMLIKLFLFCFFFFLV